MSTTKLSSGDLVEIRSKEEILRTLDRDGRLDGLPFMPQMFDFCGKRLRVYKRAHKTCDTVNGTGGRSMKAAVHLEDVRCDGAAYDGCQAGCLIFWKEAWLKPVGQPEDPASLEATSTKSAPVCFEADVVRATRADTSDEETTYACQATCLPEATKLLPWWDPRQYMEDYASGNVNLGTIFNGMLYSGYHRLANIKIRGFYRVLTWVYDRFQQLRGGVPYPRKPGRVPDGQRTPRANLNLQPGELVRVKSYEEILKTLNYEKRNRGMVFDAEEVVYCGGTYRVLRRVEKIVDEKTGRTVHLKTPSVILDQVYCKSRYSGRRMFCPRSIYPFWREIWLERVGEDSVVSAGGAQEA